MLIIKYIILALTYLGLGLGYLPTLRMNRATIAMTGSAFMVALGVLNLSEAWSAIDPIPTRNDGDKFLFRRILTLVTLAIAYFWIY